MGDYSDDEINQAIDLALDSDDLAAVKELRKLQATQKVQGTDGYTQNEFAQAREIALQAGDLNAVRELEGLMSNQVAQVQEQELNTKYGITEDTLFQPSSELLSVLDNPANQGMFGIAQENLIEGAKNIPQNLINALPGPMKDGINSFIDDIDLPFFEDERRFEHERALERKAFEEDNLAAGITAGIARSIPAYVAPSRFIKAGKDATFAARAGVEAMRGGISAASAEEYEDGYLDPEFFKEGVIGSLGGVIGEGGATIAGKFFKETPDALAHYANQMESTFGSKLDELKAVGDVEGYENLLNTQLTPMKRFDSDGVEIPATTSISVRQMKQLSDTLKVGQELNRSGRAVSTKELGDLFGDSAVLRELGITPTKVDNVASFMKSAGGESVLDLVGGVSRKVEGITEGQFKATVQSQANLFKQSVTHADNELVKANSRKIDDIATALRDLDQSHAKSLIKSLDTKSLRKAGFNDIADETDRLVSTFKNVSKLMKKGKKESTGLNPMDAVRYGMSLTTGFMTSFAVPVLVGTSARAAKMGSRRMLSRQQGELSAKVAGRRTQAQPWDFDAPTQPTIPDKNPYTAQAAPEPIAYSGFSDVANPQKDRFIWDEGQHEITGQSTRPAYDKSSSIPTDPFEQERYFDDLRNKGHDTLFLDSGESVQLRQPQPMAKTMYDYGTDPTTGDTTFYSKHSSKWQDGKRQTKTSGTEGANAQPVEGLQVKKPVHLRASGDGSLPDFNRDDLIKQGYDSVVIDRAPHPFKPDVKQRMVIKFGATPEQDIITYVPASYGGAIAQGFPQNTDE
ncbi:hypothetical protein [Enterovibrio calviensis]|uniref:hypothetical protein n=1 Tax=Enterovibrio calviensis TaxID=91359 RepID=UPI0004871489|nr:hypothetical protein [Enterovibrio calviensis]